MASPRRDRRGATPFRVGIIALIVIVAVTYLGFTKHIPFTSGFQFKAVFTSANSIRLNSPVRIAGVNVGKVVDVQRYKNTDAAVLTMEMDDAGLPIHKDAQLKIRPRIFLEGNFFIDLRPGTPNTPDVKDGDTIPITQTATPVQLDQVLTSLQQDTRAGLQETLIGLGAGLDSRPTAAEDATQDPSVRGTTGGEALNRALRYSPEALKNVAIVNEAFLGTRPDDLSNLVSGLAKTSRKLASREVQLADLVRNFNTTMSATASQSTALSATIRLLPPTLSAANRTFASLNAAFPPTRAWAREIIPGVEQTPATIAAAFPWLDQVGPLLAPNELGGVLANLQPTTQDLSQLSAEQLKLLPQIDLVDRCMINVVLPTGDVKIKDPFFPVNRENYKEFWYALVGLSSEGQNYDGNGQYVHFQIGGGTSSTGGVFGTKSGPLSPGGDVVYGNFVDKPLGSAPRFVHQLPPFKPNATCYKQTPPNLNGPLAFGPPDHLGNPTSAAKAQAAAVRRAAQRALGDLVPGIGQPGSGVASPGPASSATSGASAGSGAAGAGGGGAHAGGGSGGGGAPAPEAVLRRPLEGTLP